MKSILLLFFFFVFLLPVSGFSAEIPEYDIKEYCEKLAEIGGGSYMIESGCRTMEEQDKAALLNMTVPDRIMRYCKEVTTLGGNSYTLLKGCIEMETESKKSLGY